MCFATQTEHLWKKHSCCCSCLVTCNNPQWHGESSAPFRVWVMPGQSTGRLPRWFSLSAQPVCPAFDPRGPWVRGREAAGRAWPVGPGRKEWPGLSLVCWLSLQVISGFVWITTSGSSSLTTLQKHFQKHEGTIPVCTLQHTQPPLELGLPVWDEHTGFQCRVLHNRQLIML